MKPGDWAYCSHHGEHCRIVAVEPLWGIKCIFEFRYLLADEVGLSKTIEAGGY